MTTLVLTATAGPGKQHFVARVTSVDRSGIINRQFYGDRNASVITEEMTKTGVYHVRSITASGGVRNSWHVVWGLGGGIFDSIEVKKAEVLEIFAEVDRRQVNRLDEPTARKVIMERAIGFYRRIVDDAIAKSPRKPVTLKRRIAGLDAGTYPFTEVGEACFRCIDRCERIVTSITEKQAQGAAELQRTIDTIRNQAPKGRVLGNPQPLGTIR